MAATDSRKPRLSIGTSPLSGFLFAVMFLISTLPCYAAESTRHTDDGDQTRSPCTSNPFDLNTAGPNVCITTRFQMATLFIEEDELYSQRGCNMLYPPETCSALWSGVISVEDLILSVDIYSCCDGFNRQGSSCQMACPAQTYGPGCALLCRCFNGGRCDPVDGACSCPAGWTGEHCRQTCPDDRYGLGCSEVCDCQNGGSCHPETGTCLCNVGYTGDRCEIDCHPCETSFCETCEAPSRCDEIVGICICPSGRRGRFCAHTCGEFAYGDGCTERCQCGANSPSCNPTDGACDCLPGWTGPRCDRPCPAGSYGDSCRLRCDCGADSGDCDPIDGLCDNQCPDGWQGEFCTDLCDAGHWGLNCSRDCNCAESETCQPITGQCLAGVTASTTPTSGVPGRIGLEAGEIAAIIVSIAVILILVAVAAAFFVRRRNTGREGTDGNVLANGAVGHPAGNPQPTATMNARYQLDASRSPSTSVPPTPFPRSPATFAQPDLLYEDVNSDAGQNSEAAAYYTELQDNPLYQASGDGYEITTPWATLDRNDEAQSESGNYYLSLTEN